MRVVRSPYLYLEPMRWVLHNGIIGYSFGWGVCSIYLIS